jgi:hypothetical protein
MKLNISFREPFALRVQPAQDRIAAPVEVIPDHPSFRFALEDFAEPRKIELLKKQRVRRIPPPENFKTKIARPTLLSIILSKLRSHSPSAKKLRLVETVSLGEKRFVAIVHADGRDFLVGGGTSGVSMLAQLDIKQNPDEGIHSVLSGSSECAV